MSMDLNKALARLRDETGGIHGYRWDGTALHQTIGGLTVDTWTIEYLERMGEEHKDRPALAQAERDVAAALRWLTGKIKVIDVEFCDVQEPL